MEVTLRYTHFCRILVATDFQECSQEAVETAASLAKTSGEELIIIHTFEPPSYTYTGIGISLVDTTAAIQEAAQQALDSAVKDLQEKGIRARGVLKCGSAWEEILTAAKEEQADLIVVGTHGRRGVSHALLGSVAEKIVRLSPVPVLTIPGWRA